ncbi:MAG TPA: methyltransferase domain-containing protein [Rhodoglobus sp.]|nr:methyltransferase domain-containing protein [Rhodoglobus sp.]
MRCAYFDAGECGSCTLMGVPYPTQLVGKQERVQALLPAMAWAEAVASREDGYRNKAKLVVGGTVDEPRLGLLAGDRVNDLRECGICAPGLRDTFPAIADFITTARLEPYDVPSRRGELKLVLVTESPDAELMIRFVLRSTESVPRIRKHLPALQAALPGLRVVTVNLLPQHRAVVEGEEELVLTEQSSLPMRVAGLTLHLRPQSFFQTNTAIADALYRQAQAWAGQPASVWDLYCGVGGFALALAAPGRDVVGVETSAEAVESARRSADGAARFVAADAGAWAAASTDRPELVVVNPPRRGIGGLAEWLEHSGVPRVLYSSCNPITLAKDLAAMPSYRPVRGRLFDMFPQTEHIEVLVQLERAA